MRRAVVGHCNAQSLRSFCVVVVSIRGSIGSRRLMAAICAQAAGSPQSHSTLPLHSKSVAASACPGWPKCPIALLTAEHRSLPYRTRPRRTAARHIAAGLDRPYSIRQQVRYQATAEMKAVHFCPLKIFPVLPRDSASSEKRSRNG